MCNVSIAKEKLRNLKKSTEKSLYELRYNSETFTELNEETYLTLRDISSESGLDCPVYKYGGEIKFHDTKEWFFDVLNILAVSYGIFLKYP